MKRKGLPPDRLQADVPAIRDALLKRHATYIDTKTTMAGLESQVAQVYKELTGNEFPKKAGWRTPAVAHEHHHGIAGNTVTSALLQPGLDDQARATRAR